MSISTISTPTFTTTPSTHSPSSENTDTPHTHTTTYTENTHTDTYPYIKKYIHYNKKILTLHNTLLSLLNQLHHTTPNIIHSMAQGTMQIPPQVYAEYIQIVEQQLGEYTCVNMFSNTHAYHNIISNALEEDLSLFINFMRSIPGVCCSVDTVTEPLRYFTTNNVFNKKLFNFFHTCFISTHLKHTNVRDPKPTDKCIAPLT